MRQILEGIQYIHSKRIVHLDLKPENIICVNSAGSLIKIIDFGLACKLGEWFILSAGVCLFFFLSRASQTMSQSTKKKNIPNLIPYFFLYSHLNKSRYTAVLYIHPRLVSVCYVGLWLGKSHMRCPFEHSHWIRIRLPDVNVLNSRTGSPHWWQVLNSPVKLDLLTAHFLSFWSTIPLVIEMGSDAASDKDLMAFKRSSNRRAVCASSSYETENNQWAVWTPLTELLVLAY